MTRKLHSNSDLEELHGLAQRLFSVAREDIGGRKFESTPGRVKTTALADGVVRITYSIRFRRTTGAKK